MSGGNFGNDRKIPWVAIFVGLVAILGGLWLGLRLFDHLSLDAFFGAGALAPDKRIFLILPAHLVILAADPAGPRQYGWFAAIVLLLTFWIMIAGPFAGLAQHYVWPGRDHFVTLSVFTLLAGPATALCLAAMKRMDIVPHRGARAFMPLWLALSIPGFVATGLTLDLVDAAGLLADGDELVSQQIWIPVLSAGVIGVWGARPAGPRHRAIIAAVLAMAMTGGVAGLAALNGYFDFPETGMLATITNSAVPIAVILAQTALVGAAKALTGPEGPWPARDDAETATPTETAK